MSDATSVEPAAADATSTAAGPSEGSSTGRRSGGRAGRAALRASHVVERVPYLTRTLKPFEIASEETLALIEHTADTVLEEVGIEIRDYPEALPIFKAGGAEVHGTRVRFPRGMCREIVSTHAPATYVQHARNPLHDVVIGGNNTVFAPNYGSPFVHDLDNGRRYATLADFQNFVKLAYM
nr:trimethylamine methyltransferase family protein [Ilumatobacteraceae bacterium]